MTDTLAINFSFYFLLIFVFNHLAFITPPLGLDSRIDDDAVYQKGRKVFSVDMNRLFLKSSGDMSSLQGWKF